VESGNSYESRGRRGVEKKIAKRRDPEFAERKTEVKGMSLAN
jgi:hypothetical protein